MSKDEFSNLMGQYSSEELARRDDEERSLRKKLFLRKLFVKFLGLVAVAAFATGIYYRAPIQTAIEKATGHSGSKSQVENPLAGQVHSPLMKQIQDAAAKRDKILDETMK